MLETLLNSDSGLTLVAGLVGMVWTVFKGSDWFKRRSNDRWETAVESLEAAVEATYRDYVKAIKDAREDGSLTPQETQQARAMARTRAKAIGERQGIDVLRVLGEDTADLWISKAVRKLKGEG